MAGQDDRASAPSMELNARSGDKPQRAPSDPRATPPHDSRTKRLPPTRRGDLPPHVDLLLITGLSRFGESLAEAFACDSAVDVHLETATDLASGLARLRERVYDVVLLCHDSRALDAPSVLEAIHTATSDIQPIVVLGEASDQEMAALCFEAGADAYLCSRTTTTRSLLWQIARARERHVLLLENQRLESAQLQRRNWEEDEATRLLDQQRHMADEAGGRAERISATLAVEYHELLRAYVVMGSGHLGATLDHWIQRALAEDVAPHDLVALHLRAVQHVLEGLGTRSANHVVHRADLLIVEVLMRVADGYRRRRAET